MSRRQLWWLATLVATGVAVILFWAPVGNGPVLCLFRRGLDLPCPGCGMTRALSHLVRGELGIALRLHPLAPLVAVELAAAWALAGLVAHGRVGRPSRPWVEGWLAGTGFLLLALWMGRLAIGDLSAVGI